MEKREARSINVGKRRDRIDCRQNATVRKGVKNTSISSRIGKFLLFSMCRHLGKLPEIVRQDTPLYSGSSVFKAFASQWFSKISIFKYSDTPFCLRSSFLKDTEGCIFKPLQELIH